MFCACCHNLFFLVITEETARLLTDLATIETKKGTAITAPTALSKEREQVQLDLKGHCGCLGLTKKNNKVYFYVGFQITWPIKTQVSPGGGEVKLDRLHVRLFDLSLAEKFGKPTKRCQKCFLRVVESFSRLARALLIGVKTSDFFFFRFSVLLRVFHE